MWCMSGDPATHLKTIQQINTIGYTTQDNIYPLMHIYVAELSQILGVNLIQLHKLIPLYFGLLYVVFMYLLAKSILPDKGQAILASVSSCTLIQGSCLNFLPNILANLLLPMALFILVKAFTTQKIQWKTLIIIILLFYPPFHIVPSFALGIFFISLWIPKRVFTLINKDIQKDDSGIGNIDKFNVNLSLLLVVWGITWISSFYRWRLNILNLFSLIAKGGSTHLSILVENIIFARSYQFNVFENVLRKTGGILLYLVLSLVSIPLLWKEMLINKENNKLISLYGPLLINGLLIILFYFINLGFSPLRMMYYIAVISTIFTGFLGYKIIEKIRVFNGVHLDKFALGLMVILLVGIFLIGTLKTYPSPYIRSQSLQTTKTEVEGGRWFFNNRDMQIEISGITFTPYRFADFLLDPEERKTQGSLPWSIWQNQRAPPHFGYNNHFSLSELYLKDTYLLITEKDKSTFSDVYPETTKDFWYPSDFERLESDYGLEKLYMNGEFDIWYINAHISEAQ